MVTFMVIVLCVVIFVVLPVALLSLRDRLEMRKYSRLPHEKPGAAADERVASLEDPRFDELEPRLGRPVPRSVRRLYGNRELIHQGCLFFSDPSDPESDVLLERFEPPDVEVLPPDSGLGVQGSILLFASTVTGGWFFMAIEDATAEDGPVYWEDEGEVVKVCDSLDTFVAGLRQPPE